MSEIDHQHLANGIDHPIDSVTNLEMASENDNIYKSTTNDTLDFPPTNQPVISNHSAIVEGNVSQHQSNQTGIDGGNSFEAHTYDNGNHNGNHGNGHQRQSSIDELLTKIVSPDARHPPVESHSVIQEQVESVNYQVTDQSSEPIDDPVTLIEDKRTSELQQYIPDPEETVNEQFDPIAEQQSQMPWDEPVHQEPLPWDQPVQQEPLPWEEQSNEQPVQQEPLPWEEQSNEQPAQQEPLPWEEQSNEQPAQQQSLPWEEQPNEQPVQQEPLPWEEQPAQPVQQEPLPWEEQPAQQSSNEVLPWEEPPKSESPREQPERANSFPWSQPARAPSLPWEERIEQTLQNQTFDDQQPIEQHESTLPWESQPETRSALPWETQQEVQQEAQQEAQHEVQQEVQQENNYPVNHPEPEPVHAEVSQSDDTFFTDLQAKQSVPEPKHIEASNPIKSLEDLFEDDTDFLNDLEPQAQPQSQSQSQSQSVDDLQSKLAQLELDDELLDDTAIHQPVQVVQPVQTVHHSSYVPQPHHNVYKPSVQTTDKSHYLQELESNKKKHDAYDFPGNMIPKSIKPAPRHFTNKYTATSQVQSPPLVHSPLTQPPITQNSLPQSQTQSKIPIPPPAIAVTEHSETIPNSYKPPIVESAKTLAPKKSFFEELPIDLPKPAARAAPVKAINVPHIQKSPTVLQQQPTKPPPVNPYKPNPTVVSNTSTPNTPFRNPPSAQYAPPAPASGLVPPPISHTHLKPTQTFPSIQPQPPTQVQSQVQPQGQPHTPVQAHVQGHTGQVGQGQVPNINTNISRTSAGTATSPYVPNAGPYGPSNHKTHSRASSIVGAKGKEYNPYAPHSVQNTLPPAAARARGGSNPRGSIYSKPQQPASKITNPELLNHRQFPVFNWSNSLNSVTLIPNISTSAYEHHLGDSIKVIRTCELLKYNTMYETFPGPLVKGKTKKKDIEKWLEKNIERLINDSLSSELLLNQILLQLVRADGDYNSIELKKGLSSVLNPSVNYSATPDIQPSMKIAANAFKLDTSGVNTAFSLIQSGNIERAIEYCVSRGDWSLALVLANFSGPEKYAKVAGDFARNTFPFQKANNKVLHLMPLLLKVGAGNIKGAIEDLSVVPTEGEYANLHWREFVACVLISGTAKTQEFLIEFGKFIGQTGNNWANEICFALAGVPLSPVMFAYLGSESTTSMYCEVYEYILSISPNTSNVSTIGFPHLLPNKLRHASILADYGYYGQSQRYIDTINNIIKSLGTRSSILNEDLLHEFQNLIYRLSNTNSEDQSWFGNRISKVNLDKLWGQIDKFIGGEDAKSKSAGDGVFSKFSPSVSRTASTVDITTLNGNGNGNGKFQSPQFNSSASFATDYPSTLAQRGSLSHPILPSLVPSSSTTSVAKYAPAKVQLGSPKSHHISGFTPAYGGDGGDLSSIKKGSGRYTPGISGSSVSARATVPFSASSNYPYLNNTGHISTSSIGSQSVNPSVSQTPTNYAKRPSVTSVLSVESFAHQQHTRSPSIQSDVSMDYPQEFKSTPKRSYDEPSSLSPEKKEVPETINESPELKTSDSLTLNQQDGPSVEENEEKHQHQHQQEQEQEQEPVAPPPKVKKQITKANPYAPPGARDVKPVGRKSKYGPSTSSVSTSKYSVPAASSSNPYSSGGYKAPGTVPESESEPEPQPQPVEKVAKGEDIPVKSVNHHHEHHGNFGPYQPQPPYRPTKNIPNIDDSFDEIADESHDSGVLRTPGIKKSVLMDNINSGNGKESLFNNYHHEESNTPKFGLDFPIPGSPEFTSRANSVVGQPGLFSSRLSQSHQSVLYQQYEVEDDTVRDYVPMIEEDEEDEEDGDVEVAKQRKLEQEAKAKAEAEAEAAKKAKLASEEAQRKAEEAASKRKPTATEGGENSNGWFSGWLGKDDGKPKAIRAKLGKTQNPFYYDEKLKRWIDKSRPIEEQQAPTGPPPPPASKKPRITTSSTTGASAPPPGSGAPPPPGGVPSSSVPPSGALGTTPGAPPTSGPPPSSNSSTRSLANAGLDDLLSLGGTSSVGGGRKPKRGGRRTYVNVMEK